MVHVDDALPSIHMTERDAGVLRDAYRAARTIIEYGSGGSTVFAAEMTSARLLSIESDGDWARGLEGAMATAGILRDGVELRHVDIGPTRDWGHPAGNRRWQSFHAYPLAPWLDGPGDADTVLIDGRFRLAAFAATCLMTTRPVRLLWDDYVPRHDYHAATVLLQPSATYDRMAAFDIRPRDYPGDAVARMIPWFFSAL